MKRKSPDATDDFAKKVKIDRLLQVFCRVRPSLQGEQCARFGLSKTALALSSGEVYTFTQVFSSEASQEQVYEAIGAPAVTGFLSGRGTLIFAYGITSSGKTHTMLGTTEAPGLVPKVLGAVLDKGAANLTVSFFEIYNEQIYDLLNRRMELKLRQDEHSTRILDLTEFPLNSSSDVSKVLKISQKERKVSGTALNEVSSRSHCVFSIQHKTELRNTQLAIVDLAGAERANRTDAAGDRMREARAINSSLSVLHRCITALKNNQNSHRADIAPYRESKLTQVLRDFFLGDAAVTLILNVNPRAVDLEETRSALKFAAIAAEITVRATTKAQSPMDTTASARLQALQEELDRTRESLSAAKSLHTTREDALQSRITQLEQQLLTIESTVRRTVVQEMEALLNEMQQKYRDNVAVLQDAHEEIVASKNRVIAEMREERAKSEPPKKLVGGNEIINRPGKKKRARKHRKRPLPCSPIASRTRKRLKEPLALVPKLSNS